MQDRNMLTILKMFPNKDPALIEELMKECRDPDDVVQRLKNDDESANWKKNETKNKKVISERPPRNGPRRQQNPRETKAAPPPSKKAKEPAGALLQKKKQPDFGPASNATWGDIKEVNGEIVSTAEPAQPKQQPQERSLPAQQEASAPANQQQQTNQQPSGQQNQNNKKNQAPHITNPESNQQQTQPDNQNKQQQQNQTPAQNENTNEKIQKPKNASLFLPVSLNNITPDLSKFGIFAGPLPQEAPPKRAPQLTCVSIQPTYVVPLRQKVLISNQLHHFEIKRPPSPPPQPKVQPPTLATHETQATPQISAPKEESSSDIQQKQQQQQLQQQVSVAQANAMPHVAQNAAIGPIGSQPLVFNYPYPPFAFPYPQYDPASNQQSQQPLAFIQYPPYNPQGYPIPFATLPPGYAPMQPTMPQGAQQPQSPQAQAQAQVSAQNQQQQQQNQRQISKNYNNNKQQYSEEPRQSYPYNNTQNNRSYQPPIHQNRSNPNYQ